MSTKSETPAHPGTFIREHVIPKDMSVTDAARRLGVGRPALSNLLNGKCVIVPHYGTQIGKVVRGRPPADFLIFSPSSTAIVRLGKEKTVAARTYVPCFPDHQGPTDPCLGGEQSRRPPPAVGASAQAGSFDRP